MSVNGIGGASANYNVQQQVQRRARGADATGAQKPAGEYDQAKYLQDLNSRLDATVIAGEWNGRDEFGSANGSTVMIHPDFLRLMHDDPELGAKYEAEINAYAKNDAEGRKRLEAQGKTITSSGMYIDEKGEMNCYMATTGEYGGGKPEMAKKTPKETMEEMLERLAEKRQKEKLEAERIAGEEVVEKRTEASYTVDTLA